MPEKWHKQKLEQEVRVMGELEFKMFSVSLRLQAS